MSDEIAVPAIEKPAYVPIDHKCREYVAGYHAGLKARVSKRPMLNTEEWALIDLRRRAGGETFVKAVGDSVVAKLDLLASHAGKHCPDIDAAGLRQQLMDNVRPSLTAIGYIPSVGTTGD